MLKDLGLLTLRAGTGLTMVAHGYPKLFGGPDKSPPEPVKKAMGENYEPAFKEGGPDNFAQTLERMEVPAPKAAAYVSGLAELAGGVALILGFKTRLSAFLILCNLAVAIRKAHWQTGFYGQGGFEHPFSLGQSALALLLTGPGRFAVDGEARARERRLGARSQRQIEKMQRRSEKRLAKLQRKTGHSLETLQSMSQQELERLQKQAGRRFQMLRRRSGQGLVALQEQTARGIEKLQEAAPAALTAR